MTAQLPVRDELGADRRRARDRVVSAATLVLAGAAVDAFVGIALLRASSSAVALGLSLLCVGALALWAGAGLLRWDGTALTVTQVLAFAGMVVAAVAVLRGQVLGVLGVGIDGAVLLLLSGAQVRRSFA